MLWISEFLYSWSICMTKLSVLTFYRRVFRFSSIRWPIIILMGICVVWIIIRTCFTIFRCSPVQYYWDKSLEGHCSIDVATYYLATDLTHTLLDVIIVALPIYEVLKMQLPLGQKIAVAGLFSCGFLYVWILLLCLQLRAYKRSQSLYRVGIPDRPVSAVRPQLH